MNIRTFFRILYGVFALVLLAFATLAVLLDLNDKELHAREQNRFECASLANWLHMSSDELTRLVRTYAVTGRPIFETYYWYLLDIRNGKQPWPEDTSGEYWDMLAAGLVEPATSGPLISLHERMVQAGFTEEELGLLQQAQLESDTLVRTEEIAMHAMKGEFEDEQGGFSRKGPPDPALANRILFDDAYYAAKGRIMAPIRAATRLIDERTRQAVDDCYRWSRYYLRGMMALLVLAALLGALSLQLVSRELLQPLRAIEEQTGTIAKDMEQLSRVTKSIANGDLSQSFCTASAKIGLSVRNEIGDLGRLHDAMRDQMEATGAAIATVTTELAQRDQALRASQEALVAANKELEAFSYSVSHDLRAPLRHISGFVQLLQAKTKDKLDAATYRYIEVISAAGKKMGDLIDDLLSFSRTSRAQMREEKVSLGQLVQECRRELETEMHGRTIEWTVGELPEVNADRALLHQVLANLLGNAVKYTRPRPVARIEVAARRENNEVIVSVRDNGAGFDMKYIDKLFGVFQRLHADTEFEGTGIGLANVRRIISRHGGRTWAEGEVDKGATFYFSLPVAGGVQHPEAAG